MKRFLTWLRQTFSPSSPKSAAIMRQAKARINPGRPGHPPPARQPKKQPASSAATTDPVTDFSTTTGVAAERPSRIVDGGPGKNVLARSRYVWEETGTHDTLKIVDDSLAETDEEDGIDPYNTGQFDRSKSWDRGSRK